jgi:OOP family OmpA-OmpF porin
MYDEYDDGDEGGASLGRKLALGVGLVAIAAAGFFAFKAVTDSGDGGSVANGGSSTSVVDSTDPATTGAAAGDRGDAGTTDPSVASTAATTEPTSSGVSTTAQAAPETTATVAPTTTAAAAAPTIAPTAPAPPAAPATVPYTTQPDGSPAWVVAIYDVDKVTLTGAVPDALASERLANLAAQTAKPGQGNIVNQLTINPAVPRSVGVRVVELTSTRFPAGSSEVLPEHALELDRLANIMNALPNLSALVIGHADQRGDEQTNYLISEARADAVRTYLTTRGVAPSRLSSRAVGESDLIDLNDDEAALALNRRTEFVLFGLLQ